MNTEKGKRKFYSTQAKGIVMAGFFLGIFLCFSSGGILLELLTTGQGSLAEHYEDTDGCVADVEIDIVNLMDELKLKSRYDVEGQLSPDSLIDITQDYGGGYDSIRPDPETSYTVNELRQLSVDGIAAEFEQLTEEYSSFLTGENAASDTEETAAGEHTEEVQTESEPSVVTDTASGLYHKGYVLEQESGILPASGTTLAEYASKHADAVSLDLLYEQLVQRASEIDAYAYQAANPSQLLSMDQNNLSFFVTDGDRVYTNVSAWKDFDADKMAGQISGMEGRSFSYVREKGILTKSTTDFTADPAEGLGTILYSTEMISDTETAFFYLNTAYPEQDSYRAEALFYNRWAGSASLLMTGTAAGIVLTILCLVFCTVQAGRRQQDETIRFQKFDAVPTEAAAAIGIIIGMVLLVFFVAYIKSWLEQHLVYHAGSPDAIRLGLCLYADGFAAVFLAFYLSLVRRIKGHILWEKSLLRAVLHLYSQVKTEARRLAISGSLLLLMHLILLPFGGGLGMVVCLLVDIVVFLYMMWEATGRETVIQGLKTLGRGELEYRVDLTDLRGNNRDLAEEVNAMGESLKELVEEKLKNERMQADLITNVSHDLKTPLTSIISYLDLIRREKIENEKINGYLEILDRKSQRLKQLTEDLVEASRASSGSLQMTMTNLNLNELILQISGEFEERLQQRELTLVLSLSEQPVSVWADSRYLWRVIENLYSNLVKYAMPGTRVYVQTAQGDTQAAFSIKNISEQSLNVDADELMQRFARGDRSRTTEGSGLGLSIAENLIHLMGGSLTISIDGDLFKAEAALQKPHETR